MKPTLVFLHGFPLDSEMWKNQKEFFKDYPIFCPDLPGTFNRPDSLFTLDEMAETINAEILTSQKNIILCGLSMGGYIAQRLLELYPENLIGLILISTRSAGDSNQAKVNRTTAIRKIKKEGLQSFINSFSKNLITKSNSENKAFFETILNITNRQPKEGIISELLALQGRIDSESFLPNIKIPSLILAGEEDTLATPSEMQEIFSKIPNHEFYVIKNSAHLAPLENPEEVNSIISNFIKKLG
jgi:3-oxoadipate enol-lactonase